MGPEYNTHFESLFQYFMGQLKTVLPPSTDIVAAYSAGTDDEQAFVQDLALFFTSFFRVRLLSWTVTWNSTARQAQAGVRQSKGPGLRVQTLRTVATMSSGHAGAHPHSGNFAGKQGGAAGRAAVPHEHIFRGRRRGV